MWVLADSIASHSFFVFHTVLSKLRILLCTKIPGGQPLLKCCNQRVWHQRSALVQCHVDHTSYPVKHSLLTFTWTGRELLDPDCMHYNLSHSHVTLERKAFCILKDCEDFSCDLHSGAIFLLIIVPNILELEQGSFSGKVCFWQVLYPSVFIPAVGPRQNLIPLLPLTAHISLFTSPHSSWCINFIWMINWLLTN